MSVPALRTDRQSLSFDPDLGGRRIIKKVDGLEVLACAGTQPVEHGMYAMAPWAGRLRDNRITREQRERWGFPGAEYAPAATFAGWALHGTCLDASIDEWRIDGSRIEMRQRIPGWSATLVTQWSVTGLQAESRLTVEADEPTPALLGWHPWFPSVLDGSPATWTLRGECAVREGAFASGEWQTWVDGQRRVDDAFHVPDRTATITWGPRALTVRNSDPWFVVFDERHDALCVEPQNGPPNAFDTPLRGDAPVARPGAPVTMTTTWEWR